MTEKVFTSYSCKIKHAIQNFLGCQVPATTKIVSIYLKSFAIRNFADHFVHLSLRQYLHFSAFLLPNANLIILLINISNT